MGKHLTIKRMLIGLVVISIIMVLALSITSFNSNTHLSNSQNRLTEIALPLETVNWEIGTTVKNFILRQEQIVRAKTIEELGQFAERQHLEQAFEESRLRLETLSMKIAGVDQEITRLAVEYAEFLERDAAVLESVRNSLNMEDEIVCQLKTLDTVGSDLQKNAEAISGKLRLANMKKSLALRKYLSDDEKTMELRQALKEWLQGELAKTQKACTDLRVAVSDLSIYGRQLLLVSTQDSITNIKANNIAQAARLVEMSLKPLREGVAVSPELEAIVQQIEQDFFLLKATLTEADDSIVVLRNQWLEEQENLKLLRASLQESVNAINASLGDLQVLSDKVRKTSEEQAIQARKIAERIIGLVGIIAIGFIMTTGTVIARRIIIPINKAVSFAHRLSKGDFSAQIDINQQDEIGMLAEAFQQMKDKIGVVLNETNELIQAIQDGRLDARGNAEVFAGDWRQLVVGLNNVIDAFVSPINMTAEYIDRISKGNIPEKISDEYKGDFNEIKYNLNMLIDAMNETTRVTEEIAGGNLSVDVRERSEHDRLMKALNRMIKELNAILLETDRLIQSVREGKLDTRGNAEAFAGSWRDLVIGVNSVIDAFARPIAMTAQSLDRLSKGDIPDTITEEYKGDFNTMKRHLNLLIESTNEVTRLAQEIAEGNLRVNVEQRSKRDELMKALGKMVMYIQEVADVTEKISNKDLHVNVTPRSEQDVLNQSLQKMVTNLQMMVEEIERSMTEVQQQNWLRTGQAELSNTMRGEQEFITLAKNVITYLAKYVQAQVGTIYLTNGDDSLQLIGSYAYTTRKGNRNTMKFGEGLIGQAALEKQGILFTNVPDDYPVVSSSLGETNPRNILIAPFIYEGDVKGVIELGTTGNFTKIQRKFLDQVAENVAIAFHSTQTREKMQTLLKATQRQAEELQQQQEELRASNEELEAQTHTLQASEQRLQQQQEELRQTNEELAQQTKELGQQREAMQAKNRTLEQTRRLVEEKAKDLEIASKYKSEFLANMSHELRTPLNSLLILSNLLAENNDGNLSEKQVEFAQTIHSCGTELLALINEILDLSKIEAGKMELKVGEMSLRGLASYIEQNFRHVAEEKDVFLHIELADDLPETIYTDQQRVEQIVKNFLSNAFKFTEDGGVNIRISRPAAEVNLSRSNLTPPHAIAIAISDTGIGIPKDKHRLIFEAFQQIDGTTRRKYDGTGLGLSISRELSKLLGGEIQLSSEEGKGSTFTLYLPEDLGQKTKAGRHPVKSEEEKGDTALYTEYIQKSPKQSDLNSDEAIQDDHCRHVLIVDDNRTMRESLTELLNGHISKVSTAATGEEAYHLLQNASVSCLVLDLGLPDISGFDFLDKLNTDSITMSLQHIIVYTGKELTKEENQRLKRYADSVIIKGNTSQERLLDELLLSIHDLESDIPEKPQRQTWQGYDNKAPLSDKTVLIVDDDIRNVYALANVLDDKGMTVLTAENGKQALQQLDESPENIDLVLMDIMMPEMDGYETTQKIREQPHFAKLPIIALTAKAMKDDRQKCLEAGANEYLAKPVDTEKLLSLLHVWLY